MSKSTLRQQQLLLQQQQQQQQMMADNDAAALAAEMFDAFCAATTMRQILGLYRNMCDTICLRPGPINEFYPKLKQKIRSWKAQALWKKFDTRASHRVYNKGSACGGSRVLVIGAGPCGLRAAIEAQLLGAKVCVVEKRDRISRNNVVHLWPFVITDLRNLGAKKFYGKFCAGSIDHISIRQLQCILLKVALLLGVEIHEGVSFLNTIEPSDGCGWRAEVTPTDHAVSHYEFDVLFGADGKRNTLEGFKRKEFRGKLAIAITANFINKKTEAEARAEEISGVAFIFNQSFFKELYQTTGIDLENIVYYKDETHYFVMTAKKHSLIDKNVIIQDFADPAELLALQNVNTDKLSDYAREAAEFSTKYQMPNLEFAVNYYGKPDVAMFDFTSMFAAEASSRVIVRKNYRLLQCLVGDSLLEPFWPTGSGCARGFLSSMDAAYMIKLYANQRNSILGTLAQRESIYRLLAQTTPENLQRDIGAYTVDPATRYPNLNKSIVNVWQVKHLIDTDDPNLLEQVHMDTNVLQQANTEMPIRRKRRTGDLMPLSTVLLRWIKAQLHSHEFVQIITEASECITNGKTLCALINRYRPDLIDLNTINDLKPIECNELAFKTLETELNIPRCISAKQSMTLENVDSKIWLAYLEQICEEFRGEIPHVKHPKIDYLLKDKSRDKKPDFSHLLSRTTKSKAKSPMLDIDLTSGGHRRSILDEEKVKRQRKNIASGSEPGFLASGHGGDTTRRAKKRRSQEKTTNIEERQQRLKEIEANRLDRQSKRKQQRYQQTQNFYKSLQMLQAQNLLREDTGDQPFEDYSIYMYRQNAPEFNDRVKMLEKKLLHPDRDRGIQSAFPRNTDEQFSNRIKSMEQQITSRTASGTDKKPKDLLRAIGKIDSNDWNIREIEKKIEQSKKTEIPGKNKEKVPKWSKEQFLARQNKMSKPPLEREEENEEKFKEIDLTLKNLDKQLKEGSIREIGERGKNKVASIAGQFGKKDDTSDEKPATQMKTSSKVPPVFKNQAASEKCHFCKQTVYLMEKISTENLILHRSCLKCHHCHTNLRLGGYAFDRDDPIGRFYCTQHFRLPAKAIRPMVRKSKQQKKSVSAVTQLPSSGVNNSTTIEQIPRGRPETVAQLDLLDRGQTPERIEFENADTMLDGEPSLEHIIDENEWTDRNFVTDSDDFESDLSSSDESDDESESFDDADEGSPIAQTLQLATDWIGKQRYSNGGSEDSDNDFYDSSDGMLDENDADSQTEGEEFKKAREMRRQEVKLLPIPTNLPTDTETEVKPKDDVQLNDNNYNNKFNQNNDSNNNNKNSNDNLTNNNLCVYSNDNNTRIHAMPSKTDIKMIERDHDHPISSEIDTLNENLFNLNNFLKLNKEVENIRKENLVKNDIMKKLSLKEKWLNETFTGASNLSLNKIGGQSEFTDLVEEKNDEKTENINMEPETEQLNGIKNIDNVVEVNNYIVDNTNDAESEMKNKYMESEMVNLTENKTNHNDVEVNTDITDKEIQNDVKLDVDINLNCAENQALGPDLENGKTLTDNLTEDIDQIISNESNNNKINVLVDTIESIKIENDLNKMQIDNSNENINSDSTVIKGNIADKDIGQLLFDVENKCSPKVRRRKTSSALKKIEARSFADTKGVIESQITGPKMSKQSSLDLSKYFPNQKQEKISTTAANKNQKTLKDVDLNQYFAQSPVLQRKTSVSTISPSTLRKSNTENIISALYKPTIKEKEAAILSPTSDSANDKNKAETSKANAKVNSVLYKPTIKEKLATSTKPTEVQVTPVVKPKPNILHYKPTMKEILAGPVSLPKAEVESPPIPPKRQKNKQNENSQKKKSKDSDFTIYDQQLDGAIDLKKKIDNSILKGDEKTTKKKIVKKVTKKSASASITGDSPKLKKNTNIEKTIKAKTANNDDDILNEILNSEDYDIRSPSIEYQKLFHEEKSPSEDISDRIEKILKETGIDLGLPSRNNSTNKKKLLKTKSLGEEEFINNKNQLSVFDVNTNEEADRSNGFQNILKRFESMSSIKHSDEKIFETKLIDINDNNVERRHSKDSKKSSSDEFSDLERTLEYLKSEWKTEATNFLQKKRRTFFSKHKSIDEVHKEIEEDKEQLKKKTEQYFEEKKTEHSNILKEKSPKRKISDNGNNKTKEIKMDQKKQEKQLIKENNSDVDKIKLRSSGNISKKPLKSIEKVKYIEICDNELDDIDVDDIFNEIVNELHIDETPIIEEYVVLNEQIFELNKEKEDLSELKNVKNSGEYKSNNNKDYSQEDSAKICPSTNVSVLEKVEDNLSSENQDIAKICPNTNVNALENVQDNLSLENQDIAKICPSTNVSVLENVQDNLSSENPISLTESSQNKENNNDLKKYVCSTEVDSLKSVCSKIPIESHSEEVNKLKLQEDIISTAKNETDNLIDKFEIVNENSLPTKRSLSKSNSPKSKNAQSNFAISENKFDDSSKLDSPKLEKVPENKVLSPATTKNIISPKKLSYINRSKSSTDEDSIEQLFSQFADDMLVDVEFNSNDELIAITPRAIVKKADIQNTEKLDDIILSSDSNIHENNDTNVKNVESIAISSIPTKCKSIENDKSNSASLELVAVELSNGISTEEQQNDEQFPMKPPRRLKTNSSSNSPDIQNIPIRAKHIAKQGEELLPSVQDVIKMIHSNDDDNLCIIPINNAKTLRFPSRYEEDEDIVMEYNAPLQTDEFVDKNNIIDEIILSQKKSSDSVSYNSNSGTPKSEICFDNNNILKENSNSIEEVFAIKEEVASTTAIVDANLEESYKIPEDDYAREPSVGEKSNQSNNLLILDKSEEILDKTQITLPEMSQNTFIDTQETNVVVNRIKNKEISPEIEKPLSVVKDNSLNTNTKNDNIAQIPDSELEDWEIIEKLEKERMTALRKRDQMYYNANNSSSIVDRPRPQTQISSSDSFESALSRSIPELSNISKGAAAAAPPPRVSKTSNDTHEENNQKPIEIIENPIHTADRAHSPSSTQSKNSSHSLSHSVESIPNRPQRQKPHQSDNISVDYGTKMLLERSQMLRDRKKDFLEDKMVQSDSESSSADDVNSATEISTDSEFDHDPITRETPKILIDDTHLRKPTKVQIKQVIIGNSTNHPPKLQNVTNTKLTSNALQNALTHQQFEFKPLVQVDPSLLSSNRLMPLKNPRPGDYLLNKTASTEGIASKTSLELKKRYLLGGEQTGIGNKIMKSGSTSILDTKLKSFHSNISECQKKLNPASDISVGMKTFLDRTTKLSSNDKIVGNFIEKKSSDSELKLKKDLEEKENVFVNSKNELNKGIEYSETVNIALIEHITKNSKTSQSIKIPSPIIETIDLLSPENEVPISILKQNEFTKEVQKNKQQDSNDSIEIIDLTYSPPTKIKEKSVITSEKPDVSKGNVQSIPDIIQQTEKIETELSKNSNTSPTTVGKTEELDNECQDTCIQVPQIPWPIKKNLNDDVESDSLSSSSSTSSLEDIQHYILDSTTSPDTHNCGAGGIVPRLEIHDTSGALMQIDSLMIIDGKYIGDPEDLPLMEIPEGMTTSTPTITEGITIVGIANSINDKTIIEKSEEISSMINENSENINISNKLPINSTKDLKFDSKNENKIESLKNLPLIYDKANEKKPKPQSLNLVKTITPGDNKFLPTTITPTVYSIDNDKTPTANDNHLTDSETEQTGQLLTETELSDWTADDAVSENFVDIEFVLNSNKGTIKRNKKGKKGKLKSINISQIKYPLRQEKYSPTIETPRECGGILENLAIGEIDFMDTGSEGSCAETFAATNNALIKNRGYIEFIENEYSPTNNFSIINLRRNEKMDLPNDSTAYKRSNSNKEILGIDYIEQGACILNSHINNEIDLKTPVNEISLPIFSIGKPMSEITPSQQSPKSQQQLQSLTDSTNELDDDSLVMMTSQSATNTTTTEESDALTVVTSPLDSSSPKVQENLITISSSTTTSSSGTNNKNRDNNKSLSSNSNNKTTSPLKHPKCSNEEQQFSNSSHSSRKRASQEDLLNNTKSKDSDEMSYEEYVRKLQQKITQISNAKDSIDVRKHKRKTSRGNGESVVPTINELDKKENDNMEIKNVSQTNKSFNENKTLSIFDTSQKFTNKIIPIDSLTQKNVSKIEIDKVPEIPTLSSKLEEITKARTKQKDLIHDLVMDKLQSKKQLNAEKRLNRSRNRSSIFSPRCGSNDNSAMFSSTPKVLMSSSNDSTKINNSTKPTTDQTQIIKDNNLNSKKNSLTRDNLQMVNQTNFVNRKQRPVSDNIDQIANNYHNYEQSQPNIEITAKLNNPQSNYITPIASTITRINRNFDETPSATKMKADARARARLKSNQDLGLSPEEKLQLLRKRYHLDLQEVVNTKNNAEELKARQRKMITSKSVNDISAVQQHSSHLLISDDNFNTTKSDANNIIDFTSDPNLSNSMNNKPVNISRRHKDPERRKSLIQAFSSFFNKGKKDNNEPSPTKDKEHKQPTEVAGGVFSRFRISPKSKDKSKEKEENPLYEQCNLTQDCLKNEFSSTPHLYNNNKIIDDTELGAVVPGVLVAVTPTAGIIKNTIDNYNYEDDEDEEPPPIPPLPLNYQRSDDENYTTDTREHHKKQRSISKASKQAELKRIRIAQEIQREQEEIEVQLKEYEARGVIIEKALRGEGQNVENLETSSMGTSDEKLLKELLEIWRNITQLKKRDEELGIRQQELKLEHRHAQLKDELNMRLSFSKLDKSSADVAAEGAILNEMLEIVAKRAALRPNEQSSVITVADSYVSSINQQSTSNESDQI